ncbi:MAG: single-stranded-DNA-specific exonuclease RecJ, partial [Dehalococcoidia bacterium]
AELSLRDLKGRLIKLIGLLAPFGYGNPHPAFLSRNVRVVDIRHLGEEGQHLKLKLRDGRVIWDAIGFGLGSGTGDLPPYLDIVYRLKWDRLGSQGALELEILDMAPPRSGSQPS